MRCLVLFGGIVWHGDGKFPADTWEFRNGQWQPVETPPGPSPRHRGAMVFDSKRGYSVLFGGQARTHEFLNDTWIYQSHRWYPKRSWFWQSGPRPRCGHMMAFDEKSGLVVLFGGIGHNLFNPRGEGISLQDTWVFDGARWR